jgi:hypothetical protein
MVRMLAVLLVLVGLSGCASSAKWLENRVAVTADGEQAHFLSVWGPISIGSRIADADAAAIAEALRERQRAKAAPQ